MRVIVSRWRVPNSAARDDGSFVISEFYVVARAVPHPVPLHYQIATMEGRMTARLMTCVFVILGVVYVLLRSVRRASTPQPLVSPWCHPVWSPNADESIRGIASRTRR